jgi:hypothetical protein
MTRRYFDLAQGLRFFNMHRGSHLVLRRLYSLRILAMCLRVFRLYQRAKIVDFRLSSKICYCWSTTSSNRYEAT